MLELRDVRKTYTTGDFTQVALNDVSIAFRDSEFVAVLGPSGSGKTTMLNIVGGLDHYDSGNLIIDGIETSSYKDRDWDAYRNNRIGFVFQSYNLIPHQSVLANVELALTLAGVSRAERRSRATAALQEVGLGEHIHKKPSQLSGGQMQRVAIARALVNDPEILLADEPTGALDSTTSVSIMNLLTRIANDRLVVMVTHNPELAEQYATRIVSLRDGVIASDTDPFVPEPLEKSGRPARRTAMSFLTAIALSFNNLMTKKGRTLMTSFAGSIGIIGIASILALANGVNSYIKGVEEDTLSLYPLTVQRQGVDLTSLLTASGGLADEASGTASTGASDGQVHEVQAMASMFGSVGTNDLRSLKSYFDDNGGGINEQVNSIQYAYDVSPLIYADDGRDTPRQVNPDVTFASLGFGATSGSSLLSSASSTSVFNELVDDLELVADSGEVVAGRWPSAYNEVAVVLSGSGGISDLTLYAMGLRDPGELDDMVEQVASEGEVTVPDDPGTYTYDELLDVTFTSLNPADLYTYDDDFKLWTDRSDDKSYLRGLLEDGEELRVVGVVQPSGDSTSLTPGIYYTRDLTKRTIDAATKSAIVASQLENPDVDVFTGKEFGAEAEEEADLSSLFKVDEEALAGAFVFDESKLQLDTSALESQLGNLDLGLGDVQLDASKLPALDVADIMSQLDLSKVIKFPDTATPAEPDTPEEEAPDSDAEQDAEDAANAATEAISALAGAYTQWATAQGLDPADTANVAAFLASEQGQVILAQAGEGTDTAALEAAMAGYLAYTVAQGADPSDVATNLPGFLASEAGQGVLEDLAGADDQADPDAGADSGQGADDSLAGKLVQGYLAYVQANNLSATDVATNLTAFLGTDEGAALLEEAGGYVDTDALSAQLQPILGAYVGDVVETYSADLAAQLGPALAAQVSSALESTMGSLAENMSQAMSINQDAFMDAFQLDRSTEELTQLLMSMAGGEAASFDGNLKKLGYAELDNPSSISIYPIDFEAKAEVINILDGYNDAAKAAGDDDKVVSYTDLVGALMTSVTDIINTISYVLIAFVAISLVVSSIMIGVITYISVLERKKEIGILRSVGARKRDIRRVFNAETLIVGFVAGMIGVGATALLTIPANAIVEANFGVANVAVLPWQAAVILVLISMALTSLAGLMPASTASRKDPVEALRSE